MVDTNNSPKREEDKPRSEKMPAKRTYVKPAFRFERMFATPTLCCGGLVISGIIGPQS
jgi:hypothetical protein